MNNTWIKKRLENHGFTVKQYTTTKIWEIRDRKGTQLVLDKSLSRAYENIKYLIIP